MQVWERILLIHLLRWFERRGLLEQIAKIAFILDGPLAMFGHPAWLSPHYQRRTETAEQSGKSSGRQRSPDHWN
jgi:hypothetical protein